MKFKKSTSLEDRRRYRRLDHICPVEFQGLNAAKQVATGWYQAFTQDVSDG